jgi:periplasmic protein TonB
LNPATRFFVNILRLAVACGLSFLFFVGISLLHAMIGFGHKTDDKAKPVQQTLLEIVRKPPEEHKKAMPQVREVKQSSNAGKALGSQVPTTLMPDLTVDAGGAGGDGAVMESHDLSVEVFEEGETDERPVAMETPPVDYPLEAREKGIEGTLIVYFIIGHDGRVKSIDVQKSPSLIITREAKRTIATWRFKPGKKKGIPVNVRAKKEVSFELQK